MMLDANEHDIGAGLADLSAGHHQPKVLGFHMASTDFETVLAGVMQTHAMAVLTGINALTHLTTFMRLMAYFSSN